jgi:hypothetical protein
VTTTTAAKPDGRRRPRRAPIPEFAAPPTRPLDHLPEGYTTNPLPPRLPEGLLIELPPESGQETPPNSPLTDQPNDPEGSGGSWLDGARSSARSALQALRERTAQRTESYSAGEPELDEKTIAELFIGITAVTISLCAWLLSRRNPTVTVRRPDEVQEQRIATPLSRIVLRHFPIDAFPDLVDGARLAGAVTEYVTDGPLIIDTLGVPGQIPNPESEYLQ